MQLARGGWWVGGWRWIHQQRAHCALVIYGLVFRAQCFYSSFNTQWDAHRFSFFFFAVAV